MPLPEVHELRPAPYERSWQRFVGRRRLTQLERFLVDPELTSLRCELVKVDDRVTELHERFDHGEGFTVESWREVRGLVSQLQLELLKDDPDVDKLRSHSLALETISGGAADDRDLWNELMPLLELRRKLADTERKREELYKVSIPAAQLALYFDDLHGAMLAAIPDRALQRALMTELTKRLNGDPDSERKRTPVSLPDAFQLSAVADAAQVDADAATLEYVEDTESDSARADVGVA